MQKDFGSILLNLVAITEKQRGEEERRKRTILVHQLAADVQARYSPKVCTLGAFKLHGNANEQRQQKAVMTKVMKIKAELAERTAAGRGVVFFGPCGTGKDHLAIALMYQAAWKHGIACRWALGIKMYSMIADSWKNSSKRPQVISPFLSPQILCISDALTPGKETLEPFKIDAMYEIIGERNARQLPTWATLNVAHEQEASDRLSQPVWDRLRDGCAVLECSWDSFRKPE